MLYLLFHLGDNCYALDASQVVEVLPLVDTKKALRSPKGIVGAINYHGTLVPIIDLTELMFGRSAPLRFSTRIILIRGSGETRQPRLLGLIAERTTETMRCDPTDFVDYGIAHDDAAHLGDIATGPRGNFVHRVELSKLLPTSVANLTLKPPE